ncbi:MAG TPA: VOC family protein [Candidatus Paceibacterota bacterium]|jgi:predicted 3-demethylubiquinone-9 3-methyltransferase (glyoxalase superfamily)|nr:VOC family protein [Candidatus Paceibacterota bacterium]
MIKKVTPFLMYDHDLGEVLEFYGSVFKELKVISAPKGPDGKVGMATFELYGQEIRAFNGGPYFKFTEAASLFIDCETQEDVDYLWEKLSEGGAESQCGWVKDKFGVSWQIIPVRLMEMIQDPDRAKADRATQAMLKMGKIIIADLEKAFNQE